MRNRLVKSIRSAFSANRLPKAAFIAAWIALLVYLSLIPRMPRVPGIPASYLSIGAHAVAYAILASLLYWWLSSPRLDWRGRMRVALVAMSIASLLGLALELLQLASGGVRAFQFTDVIVNVFGSTLGVLAMVNAEGMQVSRKLLTAVLLAGAGMFFTAALAAAAIWNPAYPYRGDHWHAQLIVSICGVEQPPFETFPGALHSHGDRLIHIHPNQPDNGGANANLGLFFAGAGGSITDSSLTLPGGRTYSDGGTCPGGSSGTLQAFIYSTETGDRLERIESPASYVPRDLQTILVEFSAE